MVFSYLIKGKFIDAITRRPFSEKRASLRWRYSLCYWKQWKNMRCRLITSWGCSRSQGYGCSPFKVVRELGLERRETVNDLAV